MNKTHGLQYLISATPLHKATEKAHLKRLMNKRTKTLVPQKDSLLASRNDPANIKKMKKGKDSKHVTMANLSESQPGDTVRVKPTKSKEKE